MKKGFTLIEIMVSIALFSIIVTAFLGLFSSAFFYQKKSLDASYLLNNASFVTEYINRALRMAQKDISAGCLSSPGLNYETFQSNQGIRFINYQGNCQEFFLEDDLLKTRKSGYVRALTPSDLAIESLKFDLLGESQEDLLQPKITFVLKIKTSGDDPQIMKMQSTVSQRQLDVQY